ncbi:septal ring lytic transglycosylase RlpA family protein [Stakelama sp. CBK3Z-3]|uniref:Endolytic peptidoglycan transglycosylase RlpA n=2 Tax=Stakelama flava TaxID=2860338 RepID=A0ABS6XM53_9SPHN|nr:septal ring lytic transglycosylase RlpA family protein [Stakelama flava]
MASWFGDEIAGQPTASGAPCDPDSLTAAHRDLPFGSRVRVTNLSNGKTVVVTITDRGPYARGRLIDLSRAAAEQIGLRARGRGQVSLALLGD